MTDEENSIEILSFSFFRTSSEISGGKKNDFLKLDHFFCFFNAVYFP